MPRVDQAQKIGMRARLESRKRLAKIGMEKANENKQQKTPRPGGNAAFI
jgi:hypothetical protein